METMETSPTSVISTTKESKDTFCFFCCKSFSDSEPERDLEYGKFGPYKTEIEQRFLKFINRQFQCVLTTSTKQGENSKEQKLPLTCPDCFTVVESYCKLYHELKCLELRLHLEIEKIRRVMKLADRLPKRVKAFRDWCGDGNNIEVGLPGGITIKTEPGVTPPPPPIVQETFFSKRQKFKRKCRRFRLKRLPRVLISSVSLNGKDETADTKLNQNDQKTYFSHFNDTSETSSTITSIVSSFCGDVAPQKAKEEIPEDREEYFLGWLVSFVTVVFLYHLQMVHIKTVSEPEILAEPDYEQIAEINSPEQDHNSIIDDEGAYPIVVKQEIPYHNDENYANEVKENEVCFPFDDISGPNVPISNILKAEEIVEEINNDDNVSGSTGKVFIVEEYPNAIERYPAAQEKEAASEITEDFSPVIKSTTTLTQECAKSLIPSQITVSKNAIKRPSSQTDFPTHVQSLIKSALLAQSEDGENSSKKQTLNTSSPVQFLSQVYLTGSSAKKRRLHSNNYDSLQRNIVSLLRESPPQSEVTEEIPEPIISSRSLRKIFKCEKCLATFSSSERLQTHIKSCSTQEEEISYENDEDSNENSEDEEDVWDEHESVPSPVQLSETDDDDDDDDKHKDSRIYSKPPVNRNLDHLIVTTQPPVKRNLDQFIVTTQPTIKAIVRNPPLSNKDYCLQCSKNFNGRFQHLCHMWRVHGQCSNAGDNLVRDIVISSGTDLMLTVDDVVYDRKGRYFCSECNRGFSEGVDLVHHSRLHGDFKCNFCKESRNFASSLSLHELMHVKSKKQQVYESTCSFSCVRCSFTTDVMEVYVAHHVETHLGLVMDAKRCPICRHSYKYTQFSDLRVAIVLHYADCHDITSDKCAQDVISTQEIRWCNNDDCKAFFRTQNQLQQHFQEVHNKSTVVSKGKNEQPRNSSSTMTANSFSSSTSAEISIIATQNNVNQASRTPTLASSLEKDFKFKCNFNNCGKPYKRQIDLDVHVLQVHLKSMEEMPECPKKCGKRFSSELLKNIHLKTHHQSDSSSVCHKNIISTSGLEKRLTSHSHEKNLSAQKSCFKPKQVSASVPSSSSGVSSMGSPSLNSENEDNEEKMKCLVSPILLLQAEDEPMVDANLQSSNDEEIIILDPLSLDGDSPSQTDYLCITSSPIIRNQISGQKDLCTSTLPLEEQRHSFDLCMNRVQDVVNKMSLETARNEISEAETS